MIGNNQRIVVNFFYFRVEWYVLQYSLGYALLSTIRYEPEEEYNKRWKLYSTFTFFSQPFQMKFLRLMEKSCEINNKSNTLVVYSGLAQR